MNLSSMSDQLGIASVAARSAGDAGRADWLLAASDRVFAASLPPIERLPNGSPRLAHEPVATGPNEWPGCDGTMRRYEFGNVACDAGCVVEAGEGGN